MQDALGRSIRGFNIFEAFPYPGITGIIPGLQGYSCVVHCIDFLAKKKPHDCHIDGIVA